MQDRRNQQHPNNVKNFSQKSLDYLQTSVFIRGLKTLKATWQLGSKYVRKLATNGIKVRGRHGGATPTKSLFPFASKVRPIAWILTLTFLLFSSLMPALASSAKHYTELNFSPLPEIKLPNYSRFQLENGMVVYLMEDHELPLVSGTALFKTGDRLEPGNKIGLAEIVGTVMRSGGTKRHSADQLNQLLEQQAASVETGIGTTSGSASFSSLSEDLEQVFGLFAEVITEPLFPQEKIDLAKTQLRGSIARRNDEPDDIASREFRKLIYGGNSPYARTVEYATLDNIPREDLQQFYQQYFYPNNMILGIVGDFDSKAMRSLLQKQFANWKPNPQIKRPGLPAVSQAKQGGVYLVNQPQLTQSNILMGHLGGQFNNPDYPALDVLNGVLNGFGGRLFNQVRSRQGLAYSVYGTWNPAFDYPGMFVAGGSTRSDATVPFIQSIFTEIKRIQSEPITPAELAFAKESVLNSFVFNFQTPEQTLSRLMRYEYYNYPQDFIFRYQRDVEKATIKDVQRVAQKYLQPNKIVTLVVGNGNDIKPPLTTLTKDVIPVDITIPEPKKATP
ncbi:peptidase M16 domain protein [Crinalium epipsammum PCC 9333]|uniref:Peptidase M16 domain protein n=1 Tax=Crinalium epipsammum PCC 9333 TaxID=1173022 RepID=K9W6F5_9CYAN|nr:pitrilysin family protein [Crinalium epipsammum]AFZ15342.1 peptidase M16 domain protein [Crinalium epipsammum PCC 9333]